MFILQKTPKCLSEICHRRDVCEVLFRCSNIQRYLEYVHDIHLPSHVRYIENDIMPKRNKKVKLDWANLSKLFHTNKKKTDSKKSIKEKKHGKKKSIVSQFLTEGNIAKCVEIKDSDDIVVVFDSTAGKRREAESVVVSSDSEDSDDMGNVNSESLDPSVFSSVLQNSLDYSNFMISEPTSSQVYSESVIVPNCQSQDMSKSHHIGNPEIRKLKSMRPWKYTKFGSKMTDKMKSSPHLMFTLLSYNVLAQDLLESHPYLYQRHHSKALIWEYRSRLLLTEIQEVNADIMCLQEVQASHMDSFYSQLNKLGYDGIFKKRTGENVDGVAIYYKKNLFDIVDYTSVEYFQPNIDVLNRHNVGLIAKLALKTQPDNMQQQIVVATTHLLFNPRRHDVKLAQMQLLLTEIERFAFQGFKYGTAVYWPVVMTGDMNFEPHTGVYKLVTEGMFRYEGLSSKTLDDNLYHVGQVLDKELIPRNLDILDTCQHWGILCKRLIEKMDHKTELRLLKVHNTDHQKIMKELNMTKQAPRSFEDFVESARSEGLLNNFVPYFGPSPIPPMPDAGSVFPNLPGGLNNFVPYFGPSPIPPMPDAGSVFPNLPGGLNNFVPYFGPSPIPPMPDAGYATGQLTHNLNLRSVYSHYEIDKNKLEVTSRQHGWVTVDYIFYSNKQNKAEGNLRLVAKYKLLNVQEAASMGPIPNMASPSDHYPLVATFYLKL